MNQRPFSIFSLTEDQAILLLETPPEQLDDPADRYIAASQLVNYPSDRAIQALIKALTLPVEDLNSRIVRRKAVETLGYLKATAALPFLQERLQDEDPYTVQNAIWSIGEIGCPDQPEQTIIGEIIALLSNERQNTRLIIQTLAKLKSTAAVEPIRAFMQADDPAIAGAAISALYQLAGEDTQLPRLVEFLQHDSVNARRSSIQDLIDARCYDAIPKIIQCPVSIAFRLRGIRLLAEAGMPTEAITFAQLETALDITIRDHPQALALVHEYDQPPSLDFVIHELYETDFSRCYLATQTLLELYPEVAPTALITEFQQKARGDYGAHYHVIKLLGWLRYQPAYDLILEALHNPAPQFQKSRFAAAIALGELGDARAIPELKTYLDNPVWALSYACLLALQQLNVAIDQAIFDTDTADFLVRAKGLRRFASSR
ncbi:MAG: HEAT repeat domain-containing protein [Spirulina sp. SIO3F2]|nr:HEAT repeat domain-containing protein [Spirulina sp. SIO3F2]